MHWKAVLGKRPGKDKECGTGALTTCFLLRGDSSHRTSTVLLSTQAGPQQAASPSSNINIQTKKSNPSVCYCHWQYHTSCEGWHHITAPLLSELRMNLSWFAKLGANNSLPLLLPAFSSLCDMSHVCADWSASRTCAFVLLSSPFGAVTKLHMSKPKSS